MATHIVKCCGHYTLMCNGNWGGFGLTLLSTHKHRFRHAPRNYWKDKENQLKTLKEVEQKLNIQQPTDWYNYRNKDIIKHGGNVLLSKYNNSMSQMLQALYPEVEWDAVRYDANLERCNNVARFNQAPRNYWKDKENQLKSFKRIEKKLNIQQPSDWYLYGTKELLANRGYTLLANNRYSFQTLLHNMYPDYTWNPARYILVSDTTHCVDSSMYQPTIGRTLAMSSFI
jgi:hypothetical protein